MKKMAASRVLALTLTLTAGSSLLARQERQASEPQFRTATNTVPIYATVLDSGNRLVTDLQREDFEVLDNGVPQPLVTFANDMQPITVVMMLDRSGSVEDKFALVEQAANEFVNQLTPEDRARIGSFAQRVQIDPDTFTSDKERLQQVIRTELQPIGPTPLWNATNVAITALSGQTGRRVVLVFTDGHDAPLGERNVSFAAVRQRTQSEEVMVYGIGLAGECAPSPEFQSPAFQSPSMNDRTPVLFQRQRGGRGGGGRTGGGQGGVRMPPPPGRGGPTIRMPGRFPVPVPVPTGRVPPKPPVFDPRSTTIDTACERARPDPNLRALTEIGGGGYFELTRADDLASTFARVAEELHRQYLLAFASTTNDGLLHRLQVRVRRPGVTVRARTGYIASK